MIGLQLHDRNYNDTLGLLHEDAYKDSQLHGMPGIDKALLEVRVLSPVDLAVSKLSRFSDEDREDIEVLARKGLIEASASRQRAEHALQAHVGNTDSVKTSIDIACRLVESLAPKRNKAVPK